MNESRGPLRAGEAGAAERGHAEGADGAEAMRARSQPNLGTEQKACCSPVSLPPESVRGCDEVDLRGTLELLTRGAGSLLCVSLGILSLNPAAITRSIANDLFSLNAGMSPGLVCPFGSCLSSPPLPLVVPRLTCGHEQIQAQEAVFSAKQRRKDSCEPGKVGTAGHQDHREGVAESSGRGCCLGLLSSLSLGLVASSCRLQL